jgi:predicted nucleic acid-binding protein
MSKYYLLDSSFLVALFLADDIHHQKILEVFDEFSKENVMFYVPCRIIEETSTVLTYKGNKNMSNKFIDFVEQDQRFLLIENNHSKELEFYRYQITQNISFIDASLIMIANDYSLEILSLDKQLMKIVSESSS